MRKLFLIILFLIPVLVVFGQNSFVYGRIINVENQHPISTVKVIRMDSLYDVSSDKNGFFKLNIPESQKLSLIFSHPDFELHTLEISTEQLNTPLLIELIPNEFPKTETPPLNYQNTLAFAPVELLFLSLTFEYERTLTDRHAVGGYATALLNRRFWMFNDNTSLTGIKVEPYYRYYAWRNNRTSGFGQFKLTYANFTIHGDNYYNQTEDTPAQAFGIGIAWGWKVFHSKFKRHSIELVLGAKFVPIITNEDELQNIFQDYQMQYWWGAFGPGAIFDVKFTLGGVF